MGTGIHGSCYRSADQGVLDWSPTLVYLIPEVCVRKMPRELEPEVYPCPPEHYEAIQGLSLAQVTRGVRREDYIMQAVISRRSVESRGMS